MTAPVGDKAACARALLVAGAALALACMAAPARGQEGASPLEAVRQTSERAALLIGQGETGGEVQRMQQDILDTLDAMIAAYQAEQAAAAGPPGEQAQGETKGPAEVTAAPRKPLAESLLPEGEWQRGRLPRAGAALESAEAWMPQLPEAERKAISDALDAGRLPRRYQELLRQYNKRLAEEGRRAE